MITTILPLLRLFLLRLADSKTSWRFPSGLRTPPLRIDVLLESKPPEIQHLSTEIGRARGHVARDKLYKYNTNTILHHTILYYTTLHYTKLCNLGILYSSSLSTSRETGFCGARGAGDAFGDNLRRGHVHVARDYGDTPSPPT